MLDIRWRILLVALAGWVNRRQLALAPAPDRPQVDDRPTAGWSAQCPAADSCADDTDGSRESHVGLSADPRSPDEPRASCCRSTIASILRAEGIGPVPERPTSWRTFLAAHWGAIAAADFFTTEVWTARGLVTYYTLFIIDLRSRRVQMWGRRRIPMRPSCFRWRARRPTRTTAVCALLTS
jgi:hypothetical protein